MGAMRVAAWRRGRPWEHPSGKSTISQEPKVPLLYIASSIGDLFVLVHDSVSRGFRSSRHIP